MKRLAHPRGGFFYVLACNSADSESHKPVLQHAMFYRLYHRSRFACCKTYARHVSLRVSLAGLRDKDRRSITEGCLLVMQAASSRPGNPPGSYLSQPSQRVSRDVLEGVGKQGRQRVRNGYPTPYWYGYVGGLGGFKLGRLSGWLMGKTCGL